MTADCLVLVANDGHGNPVPYHGGPYIGHAVRRSDLATMTRIAQVQAGGRYPQTDCFPATVLSRLDDDRRGQPMTSLEALCHTGPNGSYSSAVMAAMAQLRYAVTWVGGAPPPGWVMNPAWGGIISPAGFAAYAAAAIGYIRIDTPGAWETAPGPIPPSPQEDDMILWLCNFVVPDGRVAVFASRLGVTWWVQNPTQLADLVYQAQQAGYRIINLARVGDPTFAGPALDRDTRQILGLAA